MSAIVAIVDYGSGNIRSVEKALLKAANESGHSIIVTRDADVVARAERVVVPGVGAFADCATGLRALAGMTESLTEHVLHKGMPFLGICVGMQLLATKGLEHTATAGLNWIPGQVQRLTPETNALKIPHMGWNAIHLRNPHQVLAGLERLTDVHAYFVHSFEFIPERKVHVIADTFYGHEVVAIVGRDNLIGTQFHPEKSQEFGQWFLRNFLKWRP